TNLVAYISEYEEVALVDLDVEEPNSGLFFTGELIHSEYNLKMIPQWDESKCTLCGICQKICNYHALIQLGPSIIVFPELCHSCFACSELCPVDALPMIPKKTGTLQDFHSGNLHFIESRLDIGEEQAVATISKTKKYAAKNYGQVHITIFDSPPGTSCPVMEAVKGVDFVILVTEPTPFGLHDLSLAVETTRALKKPFGVVINRYGIGNDAVIDYCQTEHIPILAKIANSRKVAELYSTGKLIYKEIPEVKTALQDILDYCLNNIEGGLK
ncbi:MAG: 4Fe-4S binding protein, partial [Lentimicrobium sp.]|nr:4Fe-4S binding protein [Lentimicrobium sp.]